MCLLPLFTSKTLESEGTKALKNKISMKKTQRSKTFYRFNKVFQRNPIQSSTVALVAPVVTFKRGRGRPSVSLEENVKRAVIKQKNFCTFLFLN